MLVNLSNPSRDGVSLSEEHGTGAAICRRVDANADDDPTNGSTGYLRVDCSFANGGSVRGFLVFKHCGW